MHWILRVAPLFVVFWLVLSGHFSVLFLALGAFSVALVCWICLRAGVVHPPDITARLLLRLPLYFLWLGKEVVVSAFRVARAVWSPGLALRPVVETTPTEGMPVTAQVIYANSITLTPGTLSLTVAEGAVEVHALGAEDVADLRGGRLLRKVRWLEART
ncbi:Na+/H+ antiporter subunit E [Actinosynnema sp. CA-248983]